MLNNGLFLRNNNYGPMSNSRPSIMPMNPYTNNNYGPVNNNPFINTSGFMNNGYGFNSNDTGGILYSQTQPKPGFIPQIQTKFMNPSMSNSYGSVNNNPSVNPYMNTSGSMNNGYGFNSKSSGSIPYSQIQTNNKDKTNGNNKLVSVQELDQQRKNAKFEETVKRFVCYVYSLDNNKNYEQMLNIGLLKLNDTIKNKQQISEQEITEFNEAAFSMSVIFFSQEDKQKAIECYKKLGLKKLKEKSFDDVVKSFLDFCNSMNQDVKKAIFQRIGEKNLEEDLSPNNNSVAFNAAPKPTSSVIQSTLINTKNNQNGNNKADQLVKEYEEFIKFSSMYEKFSLAQLGQYLVKMEKWLTNAAELDDFVGDEDSRCSELFQNMFDHYVKMNQYFTEVAKSDTDKLLNANKELCTSFDNQINGIEQKFEQLENNNIVNKIGGSSVEDEKKKIDEYKAKIGFRKQQIDLNIKGGSIASSMVVGECNAIVGKIEENLKSIETCKKLNQKASCFKNQKNQISTVSKDNSMRSNKLAISNIKKLRNRISTTITNQNNFRECQSVKLIQELKTVDSYLEQKTNENQLDNLNKLPKTVKVEHSFKTGFNWYWGKFKNWFKKKDQIAPKNSLNSQIKAVVEQRFKEFSMERFMLPFNSLIIRSLGINPHIETLETESMFKNVFQGILSPMLKEVMNKQIGSLADALYNVIPQNQNQGKSFAGVKFAVCQYVGNATVKYWVKAVSDFIRRDSSKAYGVTRIDEFNADIYFNGLADIKGLNTDKERQKAFGQILSDEFSKCREEIKTKIEAAVKDGKNDHEICENINKYNKGLLGFCDTLLDYNLDKLDATTRGRILAMKGDNIQKRTYSSLVQTLKKNISSCQYENEIQGINEEAFLSNLSPSSKKAYEQNKIMVQESVNAPKLQGKKENAKKIKNDSLINTTSNNKEEDQYKLKKIDINKYMSKVDKATDLPSAHHGEIKNVIGPVPNSVNNSKIKTEQIIN